MEMTHDIRFDFNPINEFRKADADTKRNAISVVKYAVIVLLLHALLLFVLNNTVTVSQITPIEYEAPIKATLYFPPKVNEVTEKEKPVIETEPEKVVEEATAVDPITEVNTETVLDKVVHKLTETPKEVKNKDLSPKESPAPVIPNRNVSNRSLRNLKKSISQQMQEQALKQSYDEYIESRNSIPKSVNKFIPEGEAPEFKVKKTYVDCSNVAVKGLKILSGILGGTMRCNTSPALKEFLKEREKRHLGGKE